MVEQVGHSVVRTMRGDLGHGIALVPSHELFLDRRNRHLQLLNLCGQPAAATACPASSAIFSEGFFYAGGLTAPSSASRTLIKQSAALPCLSECQVGSVPLDLKWRHPVAAYFPIANPFTRLAPRTPWLGSWREQAGEAKGVFVPLLSGRHGGRSLV
jgi:hypothetical protein